MKNDLTEMIKAFKLVRQKLRRYQKTELWRKKSFFVCIVLEDLQCANKIDYITLRHCTAYIEKLLGQHITLETWIGGNTPYGYCFNNDHDKAKYKKVNDTRLAWLDHIISYLTKLSA